MSVYKDEKTNTWRVVYRTKDWMGTVKQTQKRGFRTKKEALNWEMEQKLKDTTDLDMKFETFAEIYKDEIRVRLKESSMQLKEYLLDTKITPYFANLSMNEIKPRHVVAWQNEMLRGRTEKGEKYSPVYLKTLHNQLSAVFNYAVKFYELRDNPAAKAGNMGKAKGQERDFWTQEEYSKFSYAVMDKPISFYAYT